MGSWNYYIEIKADKPTLDRMVFEYSQNPTYQEAFHFGTLESSYSDGYNAEFVSIIDDFLPANHLIYNFISHYVSCNLFIKTNGIECIYDFAKKSDFIKFMYDAWESKIDFVYDQLGVIMVKYKRYHKTRNKLYKKYYMRIPNSTKRFQGNS